MANDKKITRTIVTGYAYDVMKRDGSNLVKIGDVVTESAIRSTKRQTEVLIQNKISGDCVLVYVRTISKQFEISESDFKKYATEVKEVKDNKEVEKAK